MSHSAHPHPDAAEAALINRIGEAARRREPLLVRGNATKAAMLRPVQASAEVTTAAHVGIVLYSPRELIISARAGTPMPEIEAALAAEGQHLIAEPPDLSALLGVTDRTATLGGITATNLSGPRRVAWGAMRDHVMGLRAVTGRAELIHSGGRVLKNVTGLDLCKLFTGSHGTLGVITEVTLKVLPAPETVGTLVVPGLDAGAGVGALAAALGSPFGVSGAAWLPAEAAERVAGLAGLGAVALIRIEDFATSVAYRAERLARDLDRAGIVRLDDAASRAVWRAVRDARPLLAGPEDAVWRISVRPSAGPGVYEALSRDHGATGFLDWGGGLIWLAGPAEPGLHDAVMASVGAVGGHWTLMRAPDSLRGAVLVVPDEAPTLRRISERVKAAFDPSGILNPGRIAAGR
jgi:glycolate oxidase FAD binding subunit